MPLAPPGREAFLFSTMSSSPSGPSRWEKRGRSTQLATRILEVLSIRYRHPVRGTERDFTVVSAPDWVNVLAVTPDERIVLVQQFRYGIDELSWEIPGGVMEAGEDPVTAGLRELREESGFTGARARLLGTVHPNPAIQSNRCHFVLVEDAVQSHALEWDQDEELFTTTEPVADVLAKARAGGITHALVLNALFMYEPLWRAKHGR